jgi:hypothetical protein
MKKIESGWYRNEAEGFDVYLVHCRKPRTGGREAHWGWSIRNGQHVKARDGGCATKAQAIECARRALGGRS